MRPSRACAHNARGKCRMRAIASVLRDQTYRELVYRAYVVLRPKALQSPRSGDLVNNGDADLNAKPEPSKLNTHSQADDNPVKASGALTDCEFSPSRWLDALRSEERFGISLGLA